MPQVELAYNDYVSAAIGLAPNEVHMNRLPRLPLTIFEHRYARGHQSPARDHLEYGDLAADRLRRAYALARAQHALTCFPGGAPYFSALGRTQATPYLHRRWLGMDLKHRGYHSPER